MRLRSTAVMALAATLVLGAATHVQAQSISPSSVSATMTVGSTLTIHKTITLGPSGANLVDLFFLADNTGSMGGIVGNAKSGATAILNNLTAGVDYNFGVGRYLGDPSEGFGEGYTQNTAMTNNKTAVQTGINAWFASGGYDYPEGNLYALKRVANEAAWRTGSQRLLVWFGDAPGWERTTTMAQAIAALQAKGITVIAFNGAAAGDGMDCSNGAICNKYGDTPPGSLAYSQASTITAATGGTLTNNFASVPLATFVQKVNDEISLASSTLDLVFGHTAGSGLSVSFTCTDAAGCNDVAGGESRTFDVEITALTPGTYDFDVFASGVSAKEFDRIVVTDTVVPEPSTWILLATGLMGLGVAAWRRKEEHESV